MIFNGSAGNEIFEFLANGERLTFTRNLGNIVMDVNEVEQVDLEALGGTDLTTVNDLSGTDVRDINVDLEGVLGGGAADGAADTVTVNATDRSTSSTWLRSPARPTSRGSRPPSASHTRIHSSTS